MKKISVKSSPLKCRVLSEEKKHPELKYCVFFSRVATKLVESGTGPASKFDKESFLEL